jgi:hypothetical protein
VAGLISGLRSATGAALAVVALGSVAGVAMAATEFAPVAKVEVAGGSCAVINDADPSLADRCSLSGFERHGGALLALGALTVAMAYGAGVGRSRPAGAALVAIGVLVLAITLVSDLPQTSRTGAIGPRFEGAKGSPGAGFWLELAGGVLAVGAGCTALLSRPPGTPQRQARDARAGSSGPARPSA